MTELPPLPDPVKITRIEIAPCKGKWQVGTVNGGESIDAAEAVETANRPAVGTEVKLHGLVGSSNNGRFGKALSWDAETRQHAVDLGAQVRWGREIPALTVYANPTNVSVVTPPAEKTVQLDLTSEPTSLRVWTKAPKGTCPRTAGTAPSPQLTISTHRPFPPSHPTLLSFTPALAFAALPRQGSKISVKLYSFTEVDAHNAQRAENCTCRCGPGTKCTCPAYPCQDRPRLDVLRDRGADIPHRPVGCFEVLGRGMVNAGLRPSHPDWNRIVADARKDVYCARCPPDWEKAVYVNRGLVWPQLEGEGEAGKEIDFVFKGLPTAGLLHGIVPNKRHKSRLPQTDINRLQLLVECTDQGTKSTATILSVGPAVPHQDEWDVVTHRRRYHVPAEHLARVVEEPFPRIGLTPTAECSDVYMGLPGVDDLPDTAAAPAAPAAAVAGPAAAPAAAAAGPAAAVAAGDGPAAELGPVECNDSECRARSGDKFSAGHHFHCPHKVTIDGRTQCQYHSDRKTGMAKAANMRDHMQGTKHTASAGLTCSQCKKAGFHNAASLTEHQRKTCLHKN